MKQKSRLWIWIIKQIPINYIFGIVEDAHKWQKQSLLHELEDGKSKKRNYFRVLKFASLVIAIILTVFVSTGINKSFSTALTLKLAHAANTRVNNFFISS